MKNIVWSFSLFFRNFVDFKFWILVKSPLKQVLLADLISPSTHPNMAEKNVSTSFWVRAAPKSWSKYTTVIVYPLSAMTL